MKQYTTPEQTAKLIELGFEKPKSAISYSYPVQSENQQAFEASLGLAPYLATVDQIEFDYAYSIGELIEMLPEAICESKDDDYHYFLSIETDSLTWKVFYESEDEVVLCSTFGVELVDALCSMLTILKRQGTL